MDYLGITWLFIIISIALLFGVAYLIVKKQKDTSIYIVPVVITITLVITGLLGTSCWYDATIDIPMDYQATCEAVDEIELLLIRYDNVTIIDDMTISTIGQGMESSKLKQQLANLIERKYNLSEKINSMLEHPLTPFKDRLEESLVAINWA